MSSDWSDKQLEELRKLAEARFGHLSAAERKMLEGAIEGDYAYCGPEELKDPHNNPSAAGKWAQDRRIRAELLRWLCIDKTAESFVDLDGIIVQGGKIEGALYLSSASIRFPLEFWNCYFTDEIQLVSASVASLRLTGSFTQSIEADGLSVKADVFLDDGFTAHGEVTLIGAEIHGNLQCNRGVFINPPEPDDDEDESGTALTLQNVNVNGDVFLSDGFKAHGLVSLSGARVGGYLSCSDGSFKNPYVQGVEESGTAIDGEFMVVAQNVELNNGFKAKGCVALLGARIGGDMDCANGHFSNPAQKKHDEHEYSGVALESNYINVNGNVSFTGGFVAEGETDLLGAQIAGDLECDGATFAGVTAQRASVRQTLFWTNIKNTEGVSLDLEDASVSSLVDEKASWPKLGKLSLNRFTYKSLAEDIDVGARLQWLALQDSFAPQPYRQLAKLLRDDGDDHGARRVLFAMESRKRNDLEKRKRALGKHGWIRRLWNWIFRLTIGYGIYPSRAAWALLLLVVLGWAVYGQAYANKLLTPTNQSAYDHFTANGSSPDYYQQFYPLVYSAESCFPLVKLGQSDAWTTNPKREDLLASTVRIFHWFQVALGWILATFFVAGVSGITRRD